MLGGKELPFVRKTPFSVSISRNHISFLSANGIKQHGCFHNCTWHSAYASLIGHSLCSRFLLFTSRESVYSSVGRVSETCVDIQVTKCWPARNKRPRLWPAALVTGTVILPLRTFALSSWNQRRKPCDICACNCNPPVWFTTNQTHNNASLAYTLLSAPLLQNNCVVRSK